METQVTEEIIEKKKFNKTNVFLWILAILITIASVYYQRITGPTYPKSGNILYNGKQINYKLDRSGLTTEATQIKILTEDPSIKGTLIWKGFNTKEDEQGIAMRFENGYLVAELPKKEITATKLQYYIKLSSDKSNNNQNIESFGYIPDKTGVVIRFRDSVPLIILILHIIFIFSFELMTLKTGMEFFRKEPNYKVYTFFTLGFAFIGGLILGPLVQQYAFGDFWTGFPFGIDLTDNKMIIAFIAWLTALIALYKSKKPGYWILGAVILTLVIFLIPHSVLSGNSPK